MMALAQWSLFDASLALQERKVSALELVDAMLDRAVRSNEKTNAFLRIDGDLARSRAKAADAERARGHARGPLHGIPVAHKDMFARKGEPVSCGSRIDLPLPGRTATVLSRLDKAGAIQIGVLNMSSFAVGPTGHNAAMGHCRNPWNTDRIPGGSSSGAGAAVASRASFGALGSDTAGSIRIPAGLCGLTGLKPTQGRVSRAGAMALSTTLDTIGPLARTAQDCATLLSAIAGVDADDPTTAHVEVPDYARGLNRSVKGLRIGVASNYFHDNVDPQILAHLEGALATLRDLGADIVPVEVPDLSSMDVAAGLITACEAAAQHLPLLRSMPQAYGQHFRMRIERGYAIPAHTYVNALRRRETALAEFRCAVFDKVAVLLTPTVPILTPALDGAAGETVAGAEQVQADLLRLTRPMNYLGLPALALPMGFSKDGMPLSMQLIGRPFSEDVLLGVGHAYQGSSQWHLSAPDI